MSRAGIPSRVLESLACSEVARNEVTRLHVVPESSAILIEARSNVGPISFGTNALTGHLDARLEDGELAVEPAAQAETDVELRTLTSGNALYDAELAQRLDVRRYASSQIVLRELTAMPALGLGHRYSVVGDVSLHGVTRTISGAISASASGDGSLQITGEQVLDIRDFDIPTPAVLMLRIYPGVNMRLQLELTTQPK